MKVDHYTATLSGQDGAEVLAWVLDALPVEAELGKDGSLKRYAYAHAVPLLSDGDVVAAVRWGGNADTVSLELKGSVADRVYGLVRAHYPGHASTRMDVAVDGTGIGLYDRTVERMLAIREELPTNRRPKIDQRGDWITPAGRSLYVGSQESGFRVVAYEKGHEREARLGVENPDPNWVRLEARCTPSDRLAKLLLAQLSPLEVWGLSRWGAAYLEAFNGLEPDPVQIPKRIADDDRAYGALLSQYGALMARRAGDDWSAFGRALGRDLEALQRLRQDKAA